MKKRNLIVLAALLALGMTACGKEETPTTEVDYDMTFANETGIDVEKLEIRYADDAEWSAIALTGGIWENGYEIPVSMQGQMPVAEDGWQVQMTFADGEIQEEKIWEGIAFADDTTFVFSLKDGKAVCETSEQTAEDGFSDTDALTEE